MTTSDSPFKDLEPLTYHLSYLQKDLRHDGRKLSDFTTASMQVNVISHAYGSSLVRLGNTSILCAIKGELCEPHPRQPEQGFALINMETALETNELLSAEMTRTTETLTKILPGVLRLEDMCIVPGKLCWVLYCDFMVLDFDGEVLNAATTALMAALSTCRRPTVMLPPTSENEEIVQPTTRNLASMVKSSMIDHKTLIGIDVLKLPAAVRFLVVEEKILTEPTLEELNLFSNFVELMCDELGNILHMRTAGLAGLTERVLSHCVGETVKRQKYLAYLIEEACNVVTQR